MIKNLLPEDVEKIRSAYDSIESPCHYCDFRDGLQCNAFDEKILEDSPGVYIPCDDCEQFAIDAGLS